VDTAFADIYPFWGDVLCKFDLTRISGEHRTTTSHRNLDNWGELKDFLNNSYIEKTLLDFHASQLFKAIKKKKCKNRGVKSENPDAGIAVSRVCRTQLQ
jgi:hypothetical protein